MHNLGLYASGIFTPPGAFFLIQNQNAGARLISLNEGRNQSSGKHAQQAAKSVIRKNAYKKVSGRIVADCISRYC